MTSVVALRVRLSGDGRGRADQALDAPGPRRTGRDADWTRAPIPILVVEIASLLGAHGLEWLNLRVDLGRKELVPAGPVSAALVA